MQIIPHFMEALMVGFSFETCFLDPLVVMPAKWRLAAFAACMLALSFMFAQFYAHPVSIG